MEVYFGANTTLAALGIPLDNNFIVLDNGIGMNYTINAPFVGPVYERAIKAGLRVLVYEVCAPPHLPTSPHISPHLPTSPHTSPTLPTPPHTSPHLPSPFTIAGLR